MPTRPFSDLYDYVLPYVPSAETRLVDFHIRRVTREFCRRTTLWRRRVELVTTPGVEDYILSPYDAAIGGGSGGGGGGGGGWVFPNDQTVTTLGLIEIGTQGSGSVTLQDNGSVVFSSSDNFDDIDGGVSFGVTFDPPVPVRVTFPSFYERMVELASQPYTLQFADGIGTEIQNQAPQINGVFGEFLPTPAFLDETTPIAAVRFFQGTGGETSSYVSAIAQFEVFIAGSGEPEICDPYSILTVALDGKRIDPIGESDRKPYGARPNLAKPKAWFQPSARVLHLYPAPDAAYPVVVDIVCALTMEPALDVMPEFLIADYREVIADGVVASLKQLNGKPWFDPEGAREFAMRFRNSTQAIRSRLRDAYRPGSFVARGPTFGR